MNFNFEYAKNEMHIIAYVYRWERDTLWKLPSKERKMWVDFIIEQKKAENPENEND